MRKWCRVLSTICRAGERAHLQSSAAVAAVKHDVIFHFGSPSHFCYCLFLLLLLLCFRTRDRNEERKKEDDAGGTVPENGSFHSLTHLPQT